MSGLHARIKPYPNKGNHRVFGVQVTQQREHSSGSLDHCIDHLQESLDVVEELENAINDLLGAYEPDTRVHYINTTS